MPDVQTITLLEAAAVLVSNWIGVALTQLAMRVSQLDMVEAEYWQPKADDRDERTRLRHNRRVLTRDALHGEVRRFQVHLLIAFGQGLMWILTPQPTNPDVTTQAIIIRLSALLVSLWLIDKSAHHLVARYRFDRPWTTDSLARNLYPALRQAWREARAGLDVAAPKEGRAR